MVNTSKIIDFDIFKSVHCSILKCIFINSTQLQNYEFIFNIEDYFWFVLWALCNLRKQWRIHAGRQVGGVSFAGGVRVDITCSCQPFQEYCQQCQEIVNLSSTTSDNRIGKKQKNCQPKSGKNKEVFQRYSVTAAGQVIPYLNNWKAKTPIRSIIGRGMTLAIKRKLLRSTRRIVQCMGNIPAP